jgi:hypothetical protein
MFRFSVSFVLAWETSGRAPWHATRGATVTFASRCRKPSMAAPRQFSSPGDFERSGLHFFFVTAMGPIR